MIVFLDMDGVCVDWCGEVNEIFYKPREFGVEGERDITKALGVTTDELWERIDHFGDRFWSELSPFGWFPKIYELCKEFGEVYFLTSPSHDAAAFSGKKKWIEKFFGRKYRDLIITPHKYLLARSDRVLIDDHKKHIKKFTRAGGKGILFPQPWNGGERFATDQDALDFTRKRLEEVKRAIHGE